MVSSIQPTKKIVIIRKIVRNIEDNGLLVALKKAAAYLAKPIYENRIYRIYGIDLEKWQFQEVKRNDFTFNVIDSTHTGVIRQIEAMDEWLCGKLESKLNNGGFCLVGLDNETVVGFNLIAFGEVYIPLIDSTKVLRIDEAWSEQITINKQYRRQGIASALRYKTFSELKHRGIKKFYGGTLRINEPQLKLSREIGFLELTDVHYKKFFGSKRRAIKRLTNEYS